MIRTLIALVPLAALALLLPTFIRAQEQGGENQAGLVVRHGDGRVVTACVAFPEPSITGIQLLERSGISFVSQGSGIGAAVCKIDGEGCDYPTEDCFCKRDGARTTYWAYSRLIESTWAYSPLGASNTKVQPGDVQGWAWGSGDTQTGAAPPVLTLDQICTVDQAAQQPTPVPPTPAPPTPIPPTPVPPTRAPAAPTRTTEPTLAPTQAATETPTASAAPTVASTSTPTGMPTTVTAAATIAATAAPAETPAPAPRAEQSSNMLGYLVFAGVALVLLAGIVIAARRR